MGSTGAGYDGEGFAFSPPRDPLLGVTPDGASVVYRDIANLSAATSWSPDAIRGALSAHAQGNFAQAAMLIETLFGDDRVQATLGSRTGALFGQAVAHDQAANDPDGAVVDAWKRAWPQLTGHGACYDIKRWAIMNGFAVCELLWDTSLPVWQPYFKQWSPLYLRYDITRRCLRAQTQSGEVDVTPGNGKWFVHAPHGMYRGWLHASVRAIAMRWLQKNDALRDWSRYNEVHGLPLVKAYVPAAGSAQQKQNFIMSLATRGSEAVVGLPQNVDETGYDVELLEARDRAWETFGGTVEACDRAIILTIKSQNLTTEVSEGSFAAARQHGNTEQVTLEFDNITFTQDLYEQVARPFALFNFGDADAAPRSTWDTTPTEDRQAEASTLLALSSAILNFKNSGVPYDVKALADQFNVVLSPGPVPSKTGTIFKYHVDAGVVTVNEVRRSLGLPDIEGGDVPTKSTSGAGGDSGE